MYILRKWYAAVLPSYAQATGRKCLSAHEVIKHGLGRGRSRREGCTNASGKAARCAATEVILGWEKPKPAAVRSGDGGLIGVCLAGGKSTWQKRLP